MDAAVYAAFTQDTGEAGHEGPWLAFLDGSLPEYPERALSMGRLHHAMMGTAAVAIGTGHSPTVLPVFRS